MSQSYAPEGHSSVSPYLVVTDAARLLDQVVSVFEGEEHMRMMNDDGTLAHGEAQIGNSIVMMGEAGNPNPPMQTMLYVYVRDCDATYRRALDAGFTSFEEPADQPYGDRRAGVVDHAENQWWVATHQGH